MIECERDLVAALLGGAAVDAALALAPTDFEEPLLGHVFAGLVDLHTDGGPLVLGLLEPRLATTEQRRTARELLSEGRMTVKNRQHVKRLVDAIAAAASERRARDVGHRLWEGEISATEAAAALAATLGAHRGTSSWATVGLSATETVEQEPTALGIYSGREHLWSGPPGIGKSWAALVEQLAEIRAGRVVVLVDFETGRDETFRRAIALGASEDELREGLQYVAPSEPIRGQVDIAAILDGDPSLVVIDSYSAMLAMQGLDPDRGADIERFGRDVLAPLRANGAAVLLIDHVTKSRESRGRWAIGSERKVARVDVHLGVEEVRPLARGATGRLRLVTHKDRRGLLARPVAVDLTFEDADGRVAAIPTPPDAEVMASVGASRDLDEAVLRAINEHDGLTRNALVAAVGARADDVRVAVTRLEAQGLVRTTTGPRRASSTTASRPTGRTRTQSEPVPRSLRPPPRPRVRL